MKAEIHPELFECKVSCSGCGTEFTTFSTREQIRVEVCSQCHPFFTGKQARIVDTEGRVEKFVKKFEGKETRVSKRKRKQAAAEEERAARLEREAKLAAEKEAEERARREEARKKRAEERAARQAAQAAKEQSAEAEALAAAEEASPEPAPESKRDGIFPYIDREKLEEFTTRSENVDLMKKASDDGQPAVEPLGHELFKEFGVSDKDDDPDKWRDTRMWIGRVVKKVMDGIGYKVDQTRGDNGNVKISGNPVFSTGSCYIRKEQSTEAEALAAEDAAPEPETNDAEAVAAVDDASAEASPAPEPGGEAEKPEDS